MCVFLWSLTFNWFSKCFISIHTNKTYFKSWLCLFGQCVSHSVVSDSLRPHGLWPAGLLCPWDSPGKNTGVGCHSLLQRIFPTQGSNPGLLHCRQILYRLSYGATAIILGLVAPHKRITVLEGSRFCLREVILCWRRHYSVRIRRDYSEFPSEGSSGKKIVPMWCES